MNRFFNFLLGAITLLLFSNAKGQDVFLSQPEILPGMETYRDWYDENTRKYLFSYMYVSRSNPNPEKARDTYNYVRMEREYRVREDGTRYIRWYADFNPTRPHPSSRGGNNYGFLLGDGLGEIKNLTFAVYDLNNGSAIIQNQSGYYNTAGDWRNGNDKWYWYATKQNAGEAYIGAQYIYQNFYRRIVYDTNGGSFGNYEGPANYMKHEMHNARAQMVKLYEQAVNGTGQVIVNAGPTQSDAYRYIYQFDTDILDGKDEHYYIAFHNIAYSRSSGGYAQHIVAFLPPEDGKEETTVYPKPTAQTITTQVGVLPTPQEGISNIGNFPANAVWSWVDAQDVSKVGNTTGKAQVVYYVNNERVLMEVVIPVVVEDNTKDNELYAPTGNTIRFLNGEDLSGKAGEFVNLSADYPTDKAKPTYEWKDATPTTTTGGSFTRVVNVIYPDGSIDEVSVGLDIVNPPAQPTVEVARLSTEDVVKSKVQEATIREYSWRNGKVAEVVSVPTADIPADSVPRLYEGTEAAVVSIENKESAGAKKVLSSSSLSGTSYSLVDGQLSITTNVSVPVRVVANDADKYAPTGKTLRMLESENIDDRAEDFVSLSDAPAGTSYTWETKPNTVDATLTAQKSVNGVVRVTYPDGTYDLVNVVSNIVAVPSQDTTAYILQGATQEEANAKLLSATNNPRFWATTTPVVLENVDTSEVKTSVAPVQITNVERNVPNKYILNGGTSSIEGTSYEKDATTNNLSIITPVEVPYAIINKPVKTDDNAIAVEKGTELSDEEILAKITNKEGWNVSSITGKNTDSEGNSTVEVVLTHPNLPNEPQTFEIPINVYVSNTPPVITAVEATKTTTINNTQDLTANFTVSDAEDDADDIKNTTVSYEITDPNGNKTTLTEEEAKNFTPTMYGNYTITATATDSDGATATANYTLTTDIARHTFFLPKGVKIETPLKVNAGENTTVFVRNTANLGLTVAGNGEMTGTILTTPATSWYSRYIRFTTPNGNVEYPTTDADNKWVVSFTEANGSEATHQCGDTFTIDQILALTTIKSGTPNMSNAQQNIINAYNETEAIVPHSSYDDLSSVEAYIAKKEFVDANGNPLDESAIPTEGTGHKVYVKVYYKDTMNGHIFGSEIVENTINYENCISFCVKPANTSSTGLDTHFGITDLGRAGETSTAWPMLRKGGWMALESNDKGFVITRMTTAQINALTAQEGMMVYDTDEKCLKLYDGTAWSCFSEPACPTE